MGPVPFAAWFPAPPKEMAVAKTPPGLPVLPAVLSHGSDRLLVRFMVAARGNRRVALSFGPDVVGGVEGVGGPDFLHTDKALPRAACLGDQLELTPVELLAQVLLQPGQRVVAELRRW